MVAEEEEIRQKWHQFTFLSYTGNRLRWHKDISSGPSFQVEFAQPYDTPHSPPGEDENPIVGV